MTLNWLFGLTLFLHGAPGTKVLTLDDALASARQSSPALQAAKAELDAARASFGVVRSESGVKATLNGFAKSGDGAPIIGSPPLSDPAANMAAPTGSFLAGNVSLMIPLFSNQLRHMIGAARWQAAAAQGDFREAEAELDFQVRSRYFRALFAEQDSQAAESRVAATREALHAAEARVENGSAIQATALRVKAELARAERDLASAQNEWAKALIELKQAIGTPLAESITLQEPQGATAPTGNLEDLLALARSQRGALHAAKAMLASSRAELSGAKAQREPKVYAFGMGDAANRRMMSGGSVGLTMSVPLLDGGRIRSEIARSTAMRDRNAAALAELDLDIESEVRQAALDVLTSQANVTSAEASLASAIAAYDTIRLRVEAGKSILLEQLDALAMVQASRADLAKAKFELNVAQARIVRATGGGK